MRKLISSLSLAALVALPLSHVLADDVTTNVVSGIATHGDTVTTSGTTSIDYSLIAESGGGDAGGCNANNPNPVTLTINAPANVTATPSSLTYTDCPSAQAVVFSSTVIGDYSITVGASGGKNNSQFDTSAATFLLHVVAPPPADTTPPEISYTLSEEANENGWHNGPVTVTWTVIDLESTPTTCAPETVTTDTESTIVSCTATSVGGEATESVEIMIDSTAPVITGTASPEPLNGWNNTPVDVSFVCEDTAGDVQSGVDPDHNTISDDNTTLSDDGVDQSVTTAGECMDLAGNIADPATVDNIDIDTTAPVITGEPDRVPDSNGWYNAPVDVSFTCADTGLVQSGIATDTVDEDNDTLSTDGVDQSVSSDGDCIDNANNAASPVTVENIDIDATGPVVTITTPADGAVYLAGSTVLADWSAEDSLSGIDGTPVATAADGVAINTTFGPHTFSVTATDAAGNDTTVEHDYEAQNYVFGGFKVPVITAKDIKQGSTVPVKLTLTLGGVPYCTSETQARLYYGPTLALATMEAVSSGSSNTGNYFRCDPITGQYIFNLSTKPLTVGTKVLKVVFSGIGAPPDVPQNITIK